MVLGMPRFAIKPRRWHDMLDAIMDKIENYERDGHALDIGKNPNGRMELLAWAHMEITRLRDKCGEQKPVRKTRLVVGPRPVAESNPITIEVI